MGITDDFRDRFPGLYGQCVALIWIILSRHWSPLYTRKRGCCCYQAVIVAIPSRLQYIIIIIISEKEEGARGIVNDL